MSEGVLPPPTHWPGIEWYKGIGNLDNGAQLVMCNYCNRRSTCIFQSDMELRESGGSKKNKGIAWCAYCNLHALRGFVSVPAGARYWTTRPWSSELPPYYPEVELPVDLASGPGRVKGNSTGGGNAGIITGAIGTGGGITGATSNVGGIITGAISPGDIGTGSISNTHDIGKGGGKGGPGHDIGKGGSGGTGSASGGGAAGNQTLYPPSTEPAGPASVYSGVGPLQVLHRLNDVDRRLAAIESVLHQMMQHLSQ